MKYLGLAAGLVAIFSFQARAQIVDMLKRIEARQKKIDTLSADLTMGRFDPMLKEWGFSKGKLILAAKRGDLKNFLLRVDTQVPREESFSVMGGSFFAYTPSLKLAYTGEVSAKTIEEKFGGFFAFLGMSKLELRKNYSVKYMGTEKIDGTPTWHLALIPKKASKIISGDIWAYQDGMVRQVRLTPRRGDQTYFKISNVKENIKLNTGQFVLNLPKDVKVMRVGRQPADVIKKPADTVNTPKKKVKRQRRAPAKPSRLKSRISKPII